MAYFDPDSAFLAPSRTAAPSAPISSTFSGLEWTVILLAKSDTLHSLRTPSRLSRALGSVLGLGVESNLADPRLEALRRLAVYTWHQRHLPAADVQRFLDAGFEPAHLALLTSSIEAAAAAQEAR